MLELAVSEFAIFVDNLQLLLAIFDLPWVIDVGGLAVAKNFIHNDSRSEEQFLV